MAEWCIHALSGMSRVSPIGNGMDIAFQVPSGRRSIRRNGMYSITFHEITEPLLRPLLNSRQSCSTPLVADACRAWRNEECGVASGCKPGAQPCFSTSEWGLWNRSGGLEEPVELVTWTSGIGCPWAVTRFGGAALKSSSQHFNCTFFSGSNSNPARWASLTIHTKGPWLRGNSSPADIGQPPPKSAWPPGNHSSSTSCSAASSSSSSSSGCLAGVKEFCEVMEWIEERSSSDAALRETAGLVDLSRSRPWTLRPSSSSCWVLSREVNGLLASPLDRNWLERLRKRSYCGLGGVSFDSSEALRWPPNSSLRTWLKPGTWWWWWLKDFVPEIKSDRNFALRSSILAACRMTFAELLAV